MIGSSNAVEYVYAKTSGMLSKSFVGSRANRLFQSKNLAELWQIVFQNTAPALPENLLAKSIEKEAENRFVKEYISLIDLFEKPEPVSLQFLRSFDYSNIKKINLSLRNNEKMLPEINDIGRFSQINYKAWPEISKMTSKGCFSWFTDIADSTDIKKFENKLDIQYVVELWDAVQKSKGEEKLAIEALIKEKLILSNIVWALRLKLYYNMEAEEIIPYLAGSTFNPEKKDVLIAPVLKILDKKLDSYSDWSSWEYAEMLNPADNADSWIIDPRYLQRSANKKVHKTALRMFHKFPCSSVVLVPWFLIRQMEFDYICTAVEGLRLDSDVDKIKEYAGV